MITIYWSEHRTEQLPEGGDREVMVIGQLELDILEQETYDVAARLPLHTAEEGISFTDNVEPENDRESFTFCVSGRQSSTRFVEGASAGSIELDGGNEVVGIIVPEGTDRIGDVHSTLRRLAHNGIDVDVDGLLRPLEGWLIERISATRTVETAGLLVADAVLFEARYAEVEEVDAPSPRVERGRRRRDRGRTTEETSTEATDVPTDAAEATSFLHGLLFGAGAGG